MMIDMTVSASRPEADLEIRDEQGRLLASALTVTTRRVQTYARIQNNTPFIIGGPNGDGLARSEKPHRRRPQRRKHSGPHQGLDYRAA